MTSTPDRVTAVRSAKRFLTYVASGPSQYAMTESLALPETQFETFRKDMLTTRDPTGAARQRRASGSSVRSARTSSRPTPPHGLASCRSLPQRAGVVAIPNAVYPRPNARLAPEITAVASTHPEMIKNTATTLSQPAGSKADR